MFGMLDYRANKLYKLIFALPAFFIYWVGIIFVPIFAVVAGSNLSSGSLTLALYSIIALFIFETIYVYVVALSLAKVLNAVFEFFIDVLPADGRTKEQGDFVARWGRVGILNLKFMQHPKEWKEEEIEEYGGLDWVQRTFFNGKTKQRLYLVKKWYDENKDYEFTETSIGELLEDKNMAASAFEKFFVNSYYRAIFYRYSFFLVLLLYALKN